MADKEPTAATETAAPIAAAVDEGVTLKKQLGIRITAEILDPETGETLARQINECGNLNPDEYKYVRNKYTAFQKDLLEGADGKPLFFLD